MRTINTVTRKAIKLVEVGPRDGLQNETKILSPQVRAEFINKLQRANIRSIEVGSFVNPKKVPQMANCNQVLDLVEKNPASQFSALAPNLKGLVEGHKSGMIDEFVLFLSATETFNLKNIGNKSDDVWPMYKAMSDEMARFGLRVRGSISCCFKCPYEGEVSHDKVLKTIDKYLSIGVDSIDIADTIGQATPEQTSALFRKIGVNFNIHDFAGHFHDSNGLAVRNIHAAIEEGVSTFHSSINGIGGCPFSPNRVGNVSTQKVVAYCNEIGYDVHSGTSIPLELKKILEVSDWITKELRN